MNFLPGSVESDEILKNSEHVLAIADNALQDGPQPRLVRRITIPFRQHRRRNSDIPTEFFGRVPAKKEPVEKRGLPLRELKILQHVFNRIGLRSHQRKPQFTDSPSGVKSPRSEKRNIQLGTARPRLTTRMV